MSQKYHRVTQTANTEILKRLNTENCQLVNTIKGLKLSCYSRSIKRHNSIDKTTPEEKAEEQRGGRPGRSWEQDISDWLENITVGTGRTTDREDIVTMDGPWDHPGSYVSTGEYQTNVR